MDDIKARKRAGRTKPGGGPAKGHSPRISLAMSREMLDEIDEVARSTGVGRSEAARSLIKRGLEQ